MGLDHLCKKISKACGALSKLRHCVGIDTLKTIYYALVNSYLRYGLLTWGNASATVLKPLNVLNNRVLRIITFAPLGRLDTSIIFEHLNILNVEKMFLLEAGKFIYKSKNNLLPLETIATHFSRNSAQSHSYFTRNHATNNVVPLQFLSNFAKKSIQLKADEIWSDIPTEIGLATSYNVFKYSFKKYLITQQ